MSTTSLGYEYFRCQRGQRDDTVYVHQLLAIAYGADPADVFGDGLEVHHDIGISWLNTPGNLFLSAHWDYGDEYAGEPIADPDEKTRAGVPISEYDRLDDLDVDDGRVEVSRNLRRHMREYRERDRAAAD